MEKNKKKSSKIKIVLIVVGIIVIVGYIGKQIEDTNAQTKQPDGKNIEKISKEEKKYIKGITPASIYEILKTKGFTIDKKSDGETVFFNCNKEEGLNNINVRIAAEDGLNVVEIRSGFTNMTNEPTHVVSKQFMSFLSSVQYENSNPDEMRKWVEDNLEKGGSKSIGGVKFEIFSKEKSIRTLLITSE
jgi:hypothetical protein